MSNVSNYLLRATEELETSRLLLENKRYRVCISRCYYAMYYATQALLASKNISSRTHKGVIQQFSQHFIKSEDLPTDMVKDLSNTYDLRQLSDYEETALLTYQQAQSTLAASTQFVERVRLFLDDTN
ncbi:hypothetical protein Lepto7375DRAFT_7047 [Leptolyngbya sp. PCC 7375]|nr:hypothetical protein Lepto7375DRAFT_7047 [Leptolyngbya sp. PCC 7375]